MFFEFLKKQKEKKKKILIIQTMILNLNIDEINKTLYLQALDILDDNQIDDIHKQVVIFAEKIEIKSIEEIHKTSFAVIDGLTQKEAEEKAKEINSFSFLINNL